MHSVDKFNLNLSNRRLSILNEILAKFNYNQYSFNTSNFSNKKVSRTLNTAIVNNKDSLPSNVYHAKDLCSYLILKCTDTYNDNDVYLAKLGINVSLKGYPLAKYILDNKEIFNNKSGYEINILLSRIFDSTPELVNMRLYNCFKNLNLISNRTIIHSALNISYFKEAIL